MLLRIRAGVREDRQRNCQRCNLPIHPRKKCNISPHFATGVPSRRKLFTPKSRDSKEDCQRRSRDFIPLMSDDAIANFKKTQRDGWAHFAPLEALTTPPAARLVTFSGVAPNQRVLDVACGTGVVAITAARRGANVAALDLTPELLERARENAKI